MNQLLVELDGFARAGCDEQLVVTLAATNRRETLDCAVVRSGRFDRHVAVRLPDQKARLGILRGGFTRRLLRIDSNFEGVLNRAKVPKVTIYISERVCAKDTAY